METPASSSLATRVVSTVHNNPNIEYDLTTDDMVISQLQESLRQTDGSALQALRLNFEHEIAQLKLELEQVQSQALIMIQQSDYEKSNLYRACSIARVNRRATVQIRGATTFAL